MSGWVSGSDFVNSSGNLSLGNSGFDDGAGNATYPYAKNDITIAVAANNLVSDTLPALTYLTGDIPSRTLAASTTHKVSIPLDAAMLRNFVAPAGRTSNPHGVAVRSLALAYRVNTTTITSITMAIRTYPLVAAAGLPTVSALTVSLAGGTLTAAANVYLLVATVTTPAFVVVADTVIDAMATIVIPGSSTVDLLGASWRCAVALY